MHLQAGRFQVVYQLEYCLARAPGRYLRSSIPVAEKDIPKLVHLPESSKAFCICISLLPMRISACLAALVAGLLQTAQGQQYTGDTIPNSLPNVPGSEITYFRISDASGKNSNLTLTNYYSHGTTNQRKLCSIAMCNHPKATQY